MCAGGEHPVEVAGENVDFDIKLSPWGDVVQRRLLRRVRNDIHREVRRIILGLAHVIHGEGHAVERDRAFGCDHWPELARDLDANPHRISFGADAEHFSDRIDVAGDDMAAELVTQAQRALEVEQGALPPEVGRGP